MSRIFLSHPHIDELEAVVLKEWLAASGWDDGFFGIDSQRGFDARYVPWQLLRTCFEENQWRHCRGQLDRLCATYRI